MLTKLADNKEELKTSEWYNDQKFEKLMTFCNEHGSKEEPEVRLAAERLREDKE